MKDTEQSKTKMKPMTSDRIKEIQMKTAFPASISVQQALLQVWNECEQYRKSQQSVITEEEIEKAASKAAFFEEDENKRRYISPAQISYRNGFTGGAEWVLDRINTDKRELLVEYDKYLSLKIPEASIDEFLNGK